MGRRQIVRIRAGDKAEVQILKRTSALAVDPPPSVDEQMAAEVVVEFHGGAIQVFVHRWEGFDVAVKTHVV